MSFTHLNKKNNKLYYLHKRGQLFYFSTNPKNSIDLPEEYKIIENPKTGLAMVKKKD